MHIPTHILSGWVAGNLLPTDGRQRLCCMLAASLADLDGLTIVAGRKAYWATHHIVGHNLLFGNAMSVVLAAVSARRWGARLAWFGVYLALFHLHLVMDYYGSGPLWSIEYLWPFSNWKVGLSDAWEFDSWQNKAAGLAMIAAAAAVIAWRWRRTPLERLMPELDRKLVAMLPERKGAEAPAGGAP